MDETQRNRLRQNLAGVRQRIEAAALRGQRDPGQVTLVAVTKYVSAEIARELFTAGCCDLAESRPQELWSKHAALADLSPRWHLVGHLQRNKAKRTAPLVDLLHSLDSRELAAELSRAAESIGRRLPALVEVNVSGDATKHGVGPEDVGAFLRDLAELPGLEIRGLMTMAHLEGGPEVARADFRRLRALRDELQASLAGAVSLDELSMGMSDDFEVAIEEGASLVRVGSALFEGIA